MNWGMIWCPSSALKETLPQFWHVHVLNEGSGDLYSGAVHLPFFQLLQLPSPAEPVCCWVTAWNSFQSCEWGHCLSLEACLLVLSAEVPRRKGSCKDASPRTFLTSKVQAFASAAYGTSWKASWWQQCHLGQTARAYPISKWHHLVLPSLIFSAKLICSGFSAIPDGLCREKLKRQISGEIYNIENDQDSALQ